MTESDGVGRPADSPAAFDGIDRLFLAGAAPDTVDDAVRQAVAGGVGHIVVLSSHGPEFEINLPPEQWYWLTIERTVEASGTRWHHLRPSAILASMLPEGCPYPGVSWAEIIRNDGVLRQPYTTAAIPHLDEDDLAALAATVLTDHEHPDGVIDVAGPAVSTLDRVRTITEILDTPIRFEQLEPDQARQLWRGQG
ncbi:hypothetical protein ACIRRA_36730 [Nocardia sp. NPDC101769]|uniref:hypothetical protein n=1 Tax=Nocardia sp. NPDC101769 TaxID=3364333 RepID=UPI003817E63A